MIYLLDTNILIYLIKNHPPEVAEKINQLPKESRLVMSFATWAELLMGAEGSVRQQQVKQQLDQLTRLVPVVYPDQPAICNHYARQALQLKRKGTPIGANDLWIACHALALEATLVTHNVREFQRVEGLLIEDWVSSQPQ